VNVELVLLLFVGVAGYPFTRFTEKASLETLSKCLRNSGLTVVELSFSKCRLYVKPGSQEVTYPSVNQVKAVRDLFEGLLVGLHAPYTVVLTSGNRKRERLSKAHFTVCFKLGNLLSANHLTFHCGPIRKQAEERVKNFLRNVMKEKEEEGYVTMPAPEVAGKKGNFAGFETLVKLAGEVGCLFCWDVAHDYARGGLVTLKEGILRRLELIDAYIDLSKYKLPIHLSGIVVTRRGEKEHTALKSGGVPWKLFLSVLREQRYLHKVAIFCEARVEGGIEGRIQEALKILDFLRGDLTIVRYNDKSKIDGFFT